MEKSIGYSANLLDILLSEKCGMTLKAEPMIFGGMKMIMCRVNINCNAEKINCTMLPRWPEVI